MKYEYVLYIYFSYNDICCIYLEIQKVRNIRMHRYVVIVIHDNIINVESGLYLLIDMNINVGNLFVFCCNVFVMV